MSIRRTGITQFIPFGIAPLNRIAITTGLGFNPVAHLIRPVRGFCNLMNAILFWTS